MPAPGGSWGADVWDVDVWAAGVWGAGVALALSAAGAPLHAIDILDAPTCAGGTVLVRATDCLSRRAEFTVTGEDSFHVEVPLSSRAAGYLTSRFVVRAQFGDDPLNFNEWRFLDDDAAVVGGGGRISATAYDLVNDLAAAGPIRDVDAVTGIPNFQYSVEATPTELIDSYLLPRLAAKGYTWIGRGTVEPGERQLWEWNALNPLELLRLIASETSSEYRLRRNGSTSYLIDLAASLNSTRATVEVRPGVNLREFRRSRKGANHYTVLEGFGIAGGDGKPATIARAAWRVTAVTPAVVGGSEAWGPDVWGADVWGADVWGAGASASATLTLADPSGAGPGPIVEDGQYTHDGPAPGYLFRYRQGGIHRILDSVAATQRVTVDSVDGYAVDDIVELRSGLGAVTADQEVTDGWAVGLWAPKRVTVVDTGNSRLTVDDPWVNVSMVPLDDRYRGWTVRPFFRAASSLMSANAAAANPLHRQCTVGSTTGMQAGDLVMHSTSDPSGAPNWGLASNAEYEVVSVDSGTLVTLKHRRKSGAVPALTNSRWLSAWRSRTDRVCTDCVAGAATIDVDSVTAIVTGDVLEVVRRYNAPVLTELASPSGVAAYGTRIGRFDRETRGEVNLLSARNPYFRDWTAGANALPDFWYGNGDPTLILQARSFGLRNQDADYLRTAPSSVKIAPPLIGVMVGSIGAGATSAVIAGSGTRLEVGESVRLSAGLGNEETVVLTSVSADGLTLGFAACANAHTNNEAVRALTVAQAPTIAGATISTDPSLTASPIDIPSLTGLDTFGLRVGLYLRGFVTGDTATIKLTLTSHPELGGSTQTGTITLDPDTNAVADAWNDVYIPLVQPIAGGRATIEIGASTAGTYPQDKALYVDAVGLFQTPYDPELVPEWSFATALHQATNAKLALVSQGAPASYDVAMVDLYGLDYRTWPHLQLVPGVTARVTEPAAGVAGVPLRITSVSVDYDRPGDTRVEMGTKHQRLTEQLAHARVSVPIVRINADGTTTITTGLSQQGFTLPTIGTIPTGPGNPEPFIVTG